MEINSQLLRLANKILILPAQRSDLDILAASFALSIALRKLGKQLGMYIEPEIYTETVKKKFPPQNIKFLQKDEPGTFVITLDNIDSAIKEVKWKDERGKVNIYITTDKGDLSQDKIKINQLQIPFDLTIIVGEGKPENLGSFYQEHKHYFTPEKTLFISNNNIAPGYELKYQRKGTSVSEAVFAFLKSLEVPVDADTATNILAGMYWRTGSFTGNLGENTFAESDELLKLGANQETAKNIALQNISFAGSSYFADVYGNIKTVGSGIFYSVVPESKLRPNGTKELLFNDFVPIDKLIGCRIAFVIAHGKDQNTVFIKSTKAKYNLTELLQRFNGAGTVTEGTFTSTLPLPQLEELLLQECRAALPAAKKMTETQTAGKEPSTYTTNSDYARITPQERGPLTSSYTPVAETKQNTLELSEPAKPAAKTINAEVLKPPALKPPKLGKLEPATPATRIKGNNNFNSQPPSLDPLAAASIAPVPLRLDDEEEQQVLAPPVPSSPLPPASF